MRAPGRPTALLLSGAGARAAYEVGVLGALAELTASAGDHAPFSIMCGLSAGALNATSLALALLAACGLNHRVRHSEASRRDRQALATG